MKKTSLIVTVFLLSAFAGYGQSRNDLKGPAAKNYKPWKYDQVEQPVYTAERENKIGPAVKNYKPWKNDIDSSELTAVQALGLRRDLKGPAAKNYKPWTIKKKTEATPVKPKKNDREPIVSKNQK